MSETAHVATVLLADDSPSYRDGLARAIAREPRLRLVDAVCDGDAALERIREHRPDVALLDVNMPGRTGLQVCAELEEECPTQVILISAAMEPHLVTAARSAGAVDGLGKDLARRRIIDALLRACARSAA